MAQKERMGIDPLLDVIGGINELQTRPSQEGDHNNVIDGKRIRLVPISQISPDPEQPRKNIDPENPHIQDLAASIKKHGFINFITVVEIAPKKYVVVAGERRLTAAKIAGLDKIPVMLLAQEKTPIERASIQLEENLLREDLTPFEEADAYERLKTEFGLQQKDIVSIIKKPKSYVSQMLSLRKISPEIQEQMKQSETMIAKRVLWDIAALPEETQREIWQKIKDEPSMSNFEKTAKRLEKQKEKRKQQEQEQESIDAELVWEALKWLAKKDKDAICSYISATKIKKLIAVYQEQK